MSFAERFSAKALKGFKDTRARIATKEGKVNVTLKEPVHKIVVQIKNEPYFKWPNKIRGDLSQRN